MKRCIDCDTGIHHGSTRCMDCHKKFRRKPIAEKNSVPQFRYPLRKMDPVAQLSPFERQERALQKGAKLVPNYTIFRG